MAKEVLDSVSPQQFYEALGSDGDRVNVTGVVDILREAGSSPFELDTFKITASTVRIEGFGKAIALAVEGRPQYPSSPESDLNLIDGFKDESVLQLMKRFPQGAIEFWDYELWRWPITIKPESGTPILIGWSRTPVALGTVLYPTTR